MKRIFTLLINFFICTISFCQVDTSKFDTSSLIPATLTAIHDGDIFDPSTFNGNIPKAGDNIIIPPGVILTISGKVNFNNDNDPATTIYNAGQILFGPKGCINFSTGSVVFGTNESIFNRDGTEKVPAIRIGNATFYGGIDSTVVGPVIFPAAIIPEKILNITAFYKKHLNIISWTTVREGSISKFQILKSSNGTKWDAVAIIPSSGSSKSIRSYSYVDTNACPVCYYRIKIIEQSGRSEYTFIRAVKNIEASDNLSLRH